MTCEVLDELIEVTVVTPSTARTSSSISLVTSSSTLDGLAPGDPGLTVAGRRLVARMDQTVKGLARVAIPKAAEAQALERLATAT